MYVRWQWWGDRRRKSIRYYWQEQASAHAVLVESVRVKGKPKQRHVAYLGSIHQTQDIRYRAWWWHDMSAKLDHLGNRIPADDRPKIEAALAEKVQQMKKVFPLLAAACLLSGCAGSPMAMERTARQNYEKSVADYRNCLAANSSNVNVCQAQRLIMETDELAFNNLWLT